jgi:hypothetical protein
MALRRSCPAADHYFLLNDGPATQVQISAASGPYTSATDVLADQPIDAGQTVAVDLPAESALWIRCSR